METYNVSPEFSHITPNVMVKILRNPYGTQAGVEVFTVGKKMPAHSHDIGLKVLNNLGDYLYMSIIEKDVLVTGNFINAKILLNEKL